MKRRVCQVDDTSVPVKGRKRHTTVTQESKFEHELEASKFKCDCDAPLPKQPRIFKNFSTACKFYGFPGSHQVGSYGPKGKGVVRTYSNATPGKDVLLDDGKLFLYRLKNVALRAQFEINQKYKRPVRVFRRDFHGVLDLGEFVVEGFVPAGPEDQIEKFGNTFVRMMKVA